MDGFEVLIAGNRSEAIKLLKQHSPRVVTLDLGLPPDADGVTEGFATLEAILAMAPHTKIIMLTSNDEHENALRAINLGAYDYCQKPFNEQDLNLIIRRAFNLAALEAENRRLTQLGPKDTPLDGVLATSPQMLAICRTIERVAPVDVTTLLLGESGTGKEVLARALHQLSPRSEKRFVAINCAAIPDALLESELFGYEKGAFTGAIKQTTGKIEAAEGGTLFLDEIGDLPLALQAKLLRFLQERVIERLGGHREIPVDVRVVCATHQDLKSKIVDSSFRDDLYYRVSEITVDIPPLRERTGDMLLLARVFLDRFSKQMNRTFKGFDANAVKAIEQYAWPGNVRELENKMKRAVILEDGDRISVAVLELGDVDVSTNVMELNIKQARDELDKQLTQKALSLYSGNVSQAAQALGVSRPTLYMMMEKYGLKME